MNTGKFVNIFFFLIVLTLIIRLIFIAFNGLLVEEAYYWNYGEHLDFGYLDHPPMVGILIKAFVLVFGLHEWTVHLPALLLSVSTAYFIYRLTELIDKGAGFYAIFLLSILPFYVMQSVVMTPDPAVMVCWSAALYSLYRALVLEEANDWYVAGVWLGLGLLSKYTIVLLSLPILFYMLRVQSARRWFARKEPYLAALIALILFSPVIYWNATHQWASFAFQGVSRFNSPTAFSFHKFMALLLFVLMPVGLLGFWQLFHKKTGAMTGLTENSLVFLQSFSLLPLAFFALFSLTHLVKFDWVGPGLLALLPWLAILIHKADPQAKMPHNLHLNWLTTAGVLCVFYLSLVVMLTFGIPEGLHQKHLKRYFSWGDLTLELNAAASQIERTTHQTPIFVPLDVYRMSSEFSFYQALFLSQGKVQKIYPVVGRHIFNYECLMYKYWFNGENLSGKPLILVATDPGYFQILEVKNDTLERTPYQTLWSHTSRAKYPIAPIYYKAVEMKPYQDLKYDCLKHGCNN